MCVSTWRLHEGHPPLFYGGANLELVPVLLSRLELFQLRHDVTQNPNHRQLRRVGRVGQGKLPCINPDAVERRLLLVAQLMLEHIEPRRFARTPCPLQGDSNRGGRMPNELEQALLK